MMSEYRGYNIDIVGTTIYVSGPKCPFFSQAPKREGWSFLDCAIDFIDSLEGYATGNSSDPSNDEYERVAKKRSLELARSLREAVDEDLKNDEKD